MYYPVLRWKGGEKLALTNIPNRYFDTLVPIWIFPPKFKFEDFFSKIENSWAGKSIIDLSRLPDIKKSIPIFLSRQNSGDYLFLLSIGQLSSMSVADRTSLKGKLGLRIELNGRYIEKLHRSTIEVLGALSISPQNFLIVFDRGSVTAKNYKETIAISKCINFYISNGFVHNVFSSGAFPESPAGVISKARF